MKILNYNQGTILRFRGKDSANVHMGFVVSSTQIMELIDVDGLCNICLTDINTKHALTNRISDNDWSFHKSPPNDWSTENKINRISEAYEEFHGSEYNKIHNNCQHFAYKAVHGYRKSPNVDELPKWLVNSGIAEMFAGASEASSDSSAALVKQYAKDAKVYIEAIQKAVTLAQKAVALAGNISNSTGLSKNFNGIIGSSSTLLNIIKNNPTVSEKESLYKEKDVEIPISPPRKRRKKIDHTLAVQRQEKSDSIEVPTSTNSSGNKVDIYDVIKQLSRLLEESLITQKEFDKKKKELLSRL